MTNADGPEAEFHRRFDEIVADMPADEIHDLLGTVPGGGSDVVAVRTVCGRRHARSRINDPGPDGEGAVAVDVESSRLDFP